MDDLFFFVGLSLLFTHEMDAIKQQEWKLFPLLSRLNDSSGFVVFTALHIPLYLLCFLGVFHPADAVRHGVIMGMDCFFLVHVALHLLFRSHPDHQFRTFFSWFLIIGAGVAGTIDLFL